MGRTLSDINHNNIFLDLSLRIIKIKTKINKWDLLKSKSFCTAKETMKKMKRQPTDWEEIFTNDVPKRGLISKIYKHLMVLNSIKTNNPLKKWAEDLNIHFPQEEIQMAGSHMKRCSTLLIIREMQVKCDITLHHLEWVSSKKIHER